LGYAPIVQGTEFAEWERYAEANIGWIEESRSTTTTQASVNNLLLKDESASVLRMQIWDLILKDKDGKEITFASETCHAYQDVATVKQVDEDPKNGPASPVWTMSPPPHSQEPSRINFNMMASEIYFNEVQDIAETRRPIFHDICSQTKVRPPCYSSRFHQFYTCVASVSHAIQKCLFVHCFIFVFSGTTLKSTVTPSKQ
jgi:hypothetical protein